MKDRKKYFSFIMAMVMMFSLAGCENSTSQNSQNSSGAEMGNNIQNEPEESKVLHLLSGSEYDGFWDENSRQQAINMNYAKIQLDDCCETEYPELALAVQELNQSKISAMLQRYNEMRSQALSEIQENEIDFRTYQLEEEVFVRRADSSVLSLAYHTFTFSNGTHGYYSNTGENFDVRTGAKLELEDVVTDMSSLPSLVKTQLDKYWSDVEFYEDVDLNAYFSSEYANISWVLDYNGITFFFNPYEIAPYSSGMQTVTLSFTEYPDLIKAEYQNIPDSYGIELSFDQPFYFDIDQDGQIDQLNISGRMDDYDTYEALVINWNANRYEIEAYCYDIDPMLIHAPNGNNYLYVQNTADSDYRSITIYSFANGQLYNAGTMGAGWYIKVNDYEDYDAMEMVLTDPTDFRLESRTDILSTLSGYKNFHVSSNGLPESSEQWYTLDRQLTLTVLFPLQGNIVDDATGEILGEKTLEVGETVIYYRTDNERFADVKLTDGTVVRLMVNSTGWPITINGVDIEEAFDGIMFAG